MKKTAQEALAQEHMPFVERLVLTECKKLRADPSCTEEMRGFALEGLAIALGRYDPGRDVSFKVFAEPRIRGAIYDGLRKLDWFPRTMRRKMEFYKRSAEMLRYRSESPAPADKVEAVHRMADTLRELATAYVTTYAAEHENEPASVAPEAELTLERKRFSKRLAFYVDTLPEKQRLVVRGYFFKDQSLPELAEQMGITTSWASRLLSAGLKTLHAALEGQRKEVEAIQQPLR